MKVAQGDLRFDDPLEVVIAREFEANGYVRLDITDRHLAELLQLPHPNASHGDPFDRLLAAQARAEGLELLSNDAKLDAYGVRRLWEKSLGRRTIGAWPSPPPSVSLPRSICAKSAPARTGGRSSSTARS